MDGTFAPVELVSKYFYKEDWGCVSKELMTLILIIVFILQLWWVEGL